MYRGLLVWVMTTMALLSLAAADQGSNCTSEAHLSRKKRLIFMTSDRRLTLPPSTILIITPTLSLPFARNWPTGYGASMTISIPFKIAFDDLGLTSEANPWGLWPDFFSRKKRNTDLPGVNWAGGDREMMYQGLEDSLANMGLDGQGCLLRAICEVFQMPLTNHGFFGEVLELFLSASRAPHAEKRLPEYVRAERVGRSTGDCQEFTSLCAHSLFTDPGHSKWADAEEFMDHYSDAEEAYDSQQDEADPQNANDSEPLSDRSTQDSPQERSSKHPKQVTQDNKKKSSSSKCKNKPR